MNSALKSDDMKHDLKSRLAWPETKRGRALRFMTIWVVVGVLTIGILWVVTGKALAQCSPDPGDPTCPTASQFQAKWDDGFFDHANGIPVNKVFGAPVKTHDLFVDKYVTYYKNHPGKQDGLYAHATKLNNNSKLRTAASRWAQRSKNKAMRKDTCFFPMTASCMAGLEWVNSIANADCGAWHTWPNLGKPASCDRYRQPTDAQNFATWDEVQAGLKITACGAATGLGIAMAVATRGGGAPQMAAAATSVGCFVTFWETFDDPN